MSEVWVVGEKTKKNVKIISIANFRSRAKPQYIIVIFSQLKEKVTVGVSRGYTDRHQGRGHP